ncbi:hypothetical protein MUK42_32521 [Musa troglodytarum]|uniref:Uncharacterized protein n=1 Tax=Musa troglodytarum TaxID=320322 RepID=A0A9E7JUX3_9LILI|nr:hypothetical protein MUK42_32521 [Musa troglodytarum]
MCFSSSVSTSHARSLSGWQPIQDLDDPHVREIAVFVVSQYNVQENKGEVSTAECMAVVYKSLKGEKVLEPFVLIREIMGGWTLVDVNNPHIHDATVFTVSEHGKEAKEHLTLVNVAKAQRQDYFLSKAIATDEMVKAHAPSRLFVALRDSEDSDIMDVGVINVYRSPATDYFLSKARWSMSSKRKRRV